MAEIHILNNAINVLKNECSRHEICEECPMSKVTTWGYVECQLRPNPCRWKFVKEQKNEQSI